MNTIYDEHINNIDDMIIFLKKYKTLISQNKTKISNSTYCALFLSNNNLDKLKDDLLYIINNIDINEVEPSIKKELDEYNDTVSNIKSMMPLITYFHFLNNISTFSQEDL